jgi:hypothetical protein
MLKADFFLSCATGRMLSRQQWDILPMPNGVMEAVENMVQDEQQPLVGHRAPLFEWTPGVPILEEVKLPILLDESIEAIIVNDEAEEDQEEIVFGLEPDITQHDNDITDREIEPETAGPHDDDRSAFELDVLDDELRSVTDLNEQHEYLNEPIILEDANPDENDKAP